MQRENRGGGGGGGSYHGVHGEVVVLSLQLHGVLVAPADLRVALQEHFLVVADPVEHLHTEQSGVTAPWGWVVAVGNEGTGNTEVKLLKIFLYFGKHLFFYVHKLLLYNLICSWF